MAGPLEGIRVLDWTQWQMGPVATAMRAKAMPGEDPETLQKPEDLAELFVKLALPDFTKNGTVVQYK